MSGIAARDLPMIAESLKRGDSNTLLADITAIKDLLMKRDPPIAEAIDAGVVPYLIGSLRARTTAQIKHQAAWALLNIAGGTDKQSDMLAEMGAIPVLIASISDGIHEDTRGMAVQALGNIAIGSAKARDQVLASGGLVTIVKVFNSFPSRGTANAATWAIRYLCRGNPWPDPRAVAVAIPVLTWLVFNDSSEIVDNAAHALGAIISGSTDATDLVLSILPRMVKLLRDRNPAVAFAAIRFFQEFTYADPSNHRAIAIGHELLPALKALLGSEHGQIRTCAAAVVGQLCEEGGDVLDDVISAGIFLDLEMILRGAQQDAKREAMEVYWTAARRVYGPKIATRLVFETPIVERMTAELESAESDRVASAVKALQSLLHHATPECLAKIKGAVPMLRKIASDRCSAGERAELILKTHYPQSEEQRLCQRVEDMVIE